MHQVGQQKRRWKSILGFGKPKSGKSTLGYYAEQPTLSLNFDNGDPFQPPGVGEDLWIQNYPPADVEVKATNPDWQRPSNVAAAMVQDLLDVRNQMMAGLEEIILTDHFTNQKVKMPRPRTIILDGLVQFNNALVDWILRDNNYTDPGAADSVKKVWGPRLDRFNKLLGWILPIPDCNKVFNTWAVKEKMFSKEYPMGQDTGKLIPDIGGKLDEWGPGLVDACLFFSTEKVGEVVRHYVQTKPNSKVECVGVRGRFDLAERVDITVIPKEVGTAQFLNPWERVWGKAVSNEKKLG